MQEIQELEARIRIALDVARGGLNDGAHHKMHTIDQMVRALTATEEAYATWVADVEEDGEYEWDIGIPG